MPSVDGIVSLTIRDYDKEITALPTFIQFDDGTESFTSLAVFVQDLIDAVSAVIDGAVVKARLTIDYAPGTHAAISGAEIERTGSISFPLATVAGRSYSYDIPAFKYSKFVGNSIPLTDSDVAILTGILTTPTDSIVVTDEKWSSALAAATKGAKTFRKHRKQTKRT